MRIPIVAKIRDGCPQTDQALTLFRNGAVLMDEASHYGDHGEAVPQKTSMASKLWYYYQYLISINIYHQSQIIDTTIIANTKSHLQSKKPSSPAHKSRPSCARPLPWPPLACQVDVVLHPLKSELNFPYGPKAWSTSCSWLAVEVLCRRLMVSYIIIW